MDGGAGPTLINSDGETLAAAVDNGGFAIEESGPVKAVIKSSGRFLDADSPCGFDPEYTVRITSTRGSADVMMEFDFVNVCGDGWLPRGFAPNGSPWWNAVYPVNELSWNFPFSLSPATRRSIVSGGDVVFRSAPGFAGTTTIAQHRGSTDHGVSDWRRATMTRGGTTLATQEAFEKPYLAIGDDAVTASVQTPCLRFREPQALTASESTLVIQFIHGPFALGEAQGVWNFEKLGLSPSALSDEEVNVRRDHGIAVAETCTP